MRQLVPRGDFFSHYKQPLTICSSLSSCETMWNCTSPGWHPGQYVTHCVFLIQATILLKLCIFSIMSKNPTWQQVSWTYSLSNLSACSVVTFPETQVYGLLQMHQLLWSAPKLLMFCIYISCGSLELSLSVTKGMFFYKG